MEEICLLENNFLDTVMDNRRNKGYEEALFIAMDSTLDMLRAIHESKGEVIEPIEFKQRVLMTVGFG